MRECIYCGRSLEKGEKCSCAMSVHKRLEKEQMNRGTNAESAQTDEREEKKAQARAEKERAKTEKAQRKAEKAAKRNAAKSNRARTMGRNVLSNLWHNIKSFLKSPTETVMNPFCMGKAEIFMLAAFEGIIGGLCVFSVLTGTSRGALKLLGNLIGFNGVAGYNFVYTWIMSAVSGAIGGIVLLLLYSGVFFAIGKWIFRMFATYWDYAKRLVFAMMPLTLIGILGVILGIFSQVTFATLLLCGLAGNVAITYEVLRSMWSSKSASRTLYAMMGGIFVFLTIVMYIVGLSLI